MTIQLTEKIPNIPVQTTGDITFELPNLGNKQIVLYFYPKDNTPGCTTEGQNFRDHYLDFQKSNTVILGVSRDTLRVHENFKRKHQFPFELISDKDECLCQLFNVIKLKKLYGREYRGIERSTFLIDRQGRLAHEWRNIKIAGHVEQVLLIAKKMSASTQV
ncbi:UNVERIFIED_CONTAM: hypothetical protein GTU68_009001 [Idotea baltica]|nr:hypothetical protein [Idotea baltica]